MPAKGVYNAIALSPQGDLLVVAGEENDGDHPFGVVRFWNLATGSEDRKPWTGARTSVKTVAFSTDGRTLATGHKDGMVKLWDVETGEEKVRLRQRTSPVIGLAFSADGQILAVAEQTGRIDLLRAATSVEVSEYERRLRER
jgi:WD40 repeat protein